MMAANSVSAAVMSGANEMVSPPGGKMLVLIDGKKLKSNAMEPIVVVVCRPPTKKVLIGPLPKSWEYTNPRRPGVGDESGGDACGPPADVDGAVVVGLPAGQERAAGRLGEADGLEDVEVEEGWAEVVVGLEEAGVRADERVVPGGVLHEANRSGAVGQSRQPDRPLIQVRHVGYGRLDSVRPCWC